MKGSNYQHPTLYLFILHVFVLSNTECVLFYRSRVSFVFFILKSSVMCLRGHRSSNSHPVPANVDLAYSEGRLDAGALE